jgi:hypothetical protein
MRFAWFGLACVALVVATVIAWRVTHHRTCHEERYGDTTYTYCR